MRQQKTSVLVILGTRPEAIKLAPVIRELHKSAHCKTTVCVTAQHRQMLDQVLDLFKIIPDFDLNVMQKDQRLSQLTSRIILDLDVVYEKVKPDWVLVQGDTTTAMAASLGAFYRGIRVGHVEAGLRTNNKRAPFPEEINRRITSVIADKHFAPTEKAKQALLTENISEDTILVTGNTVIDALLWVREEICNTPPAIPDEIKQALNCKKMILVTGHRRESFGKSFEEICLAIRDLVVNNPNIFVVYPVHLNPSVRTPVEKFLGDVERIHLLDPLPYATFVWLMDNSYLILSDSGGVQEEAPSLGKPVFVTREVTERPEGVEAGCVQLVGVGRDRIVKSVSGVLKDDELYKKMSQIKNPYGDGSAAIRIVRNLIGG